MTRESYVYNMIVEQIQVSIMTVNLYMTIRPSHQLLISHSSDLGLPIMTIVCGKIPLNVNTNEVYWTKVTLLSPLISFAHPKKKWEGRSTTFSAGGAYHWGRFDFWVLRVTVVARLKTDTFSDLTKQSPCQIAPQGPFDTNTLLWGTCVSLDIGSQDVFAQDILFEDLWSQALMSQALTS